MSNRYSFEYGADYPIMQMDLLKTAGRAAPVDKPFDHICLKSRPFFAARAATEQRGRTVCPLARRALPSCMARQSKEKYLLLLVNDAAAEDCLLINVAMGGSDRLHFIGKVWEEDDLVMPMPQEGAETAPVRMGLPELLQFSFMVPRTKGMEVLEWLQSQPFQDMIVMILSNSSPAEHLKRVFKLGIDSSPPAPRAGLNDLVELLQSYISRSGKQ